MTTLLVGLIACAPKTAEDSATDTDAATLDTTGESASATNGMTSGATSGGATETGGDTAGDQCPAPEAAIKASISINFFEWPVNMDFVPNSIAVAADCTVKAVSSKDGVVDVDLVCTEGEQVDLPISLHVEGPADFAADLVVVDAAVQLDAFWEGDAVDYVGGSWFVLHDAGGALLLAGLDYQGGAAPSAHLAPLKVEVVTGVCEPTCENGCVNPEWDMVERRGLAFTHVSGPSVEVLDQTRQQLAADGGSHDIVVADAKYYSCLNCGDSFTWILRKAM